MAIDDIMFLGDVHGLTDVVKYAMSTAARAGIDTIIQVGDFWCYYEEDLERIKHQHDHLKEKFGIAVHVHFVDGNHEDFTLIDPHADKPQDFIEGVLTYHPRGSVFEVHDVKVGCFGGAVSIDQDYRTEGVDWFPEEVPNQEDVDRAIRNFSATGIDVMVTHEIPDCAIGQVYTTNLGMSQNSLQIFDSHLVRQAVDKILAVADTPRLVHGHWHKNRIGDYSGTRIVSLNRDGVWGSMAVIRPDNHVVAVSNYSGVARFNEFPTF